MSVADQIKRGRIALGWSQDRLAEEVGVTRAAIAQWENPKTTPKLKSTHILNLARALARPPSAFQRFGGDTVTVSEDRHAVLLLRWEDLKFLQTGGEVLKEALKNPAYVEVAKEISKRAVFFKIIDDSMEPTFHEGDEVCIDPHLTPEDADDFVLVRLAGGEHLFRRYRPRDTTYDLVAENSDWDTVSVNARRPAEILGTMVLHSRKRRARK